MAFILLSDWNRYMCVYVILMSMSKKCHWKKASTIHLCLWWFSRYSSRAEWCSRDLVTGEIEILKILLTSILSYKIMWFLNESQLHLCTSVSVAPGIPSI